MTASVCLLAYFAAHKLITPCILQRTPRPADYPTYCDWLGQTFDSGLSIVLVLIAVPLILFAGFLWVLTKVRSR